MKSSEIQIGALYGATVGGTPSTVRIVAATPPGGWIATNLRTGRNIVIRSARRLRPRPLPRRAVHELVATSRRITRYVAYRCVPPYLEIYDTLRRQMTLAAWHARKQREQREQREMMEAAFR